jgi:hypothetical protein
VFFWGASGTPSTKIVPDAEGKSPRLHREGIQAADGMLPAVNGDPAVHDVTVNGPHGGGASLGPQ